MVLDDKNLQITVLPNLVTFSVSYPLPPEDVIKATKIEYPTFYRSVEALKSTHSFTTPKEIETNIKLIERHSITGWRLLVIPWKVEKISFL